MERLADLDEITLRCRNVQAKSIITEAVECYRVGAYRACVVMTWIATVYDILDKIREIALTGNSQAQALSSKLSDVQDSIHNGASAAIGAALAIERDILLIAKRDYELIDQIQYEDLARLRDDRNRCAHPTYHLAGAYYSPSAEQARVHIRNALSYVLGQPPVVGKAGIKALMTIIESENFPRSGEPVKLLLLENGLIRPSQALVIGLVDALIYGLVDKEGPLFRRRNAVAALIGVCELQADVAQRRAAHSLGKAVFQAPDSDTLDAAFAVVIQITVIWQLCTEGFRASLVNYMKQINVETIARAAYYVKNVEDIYTAICGRVGGLSLEDLIVLVENGGETIAVDRSIKMFSGASNWNSALNIYKKVVQPIIGLLKIEHLEVVIRETAQRNNDLRDSGAFRLFLQDTINQKLITHAELDEKMRAVSLDGDMNYVSPIPEGSSQG